MNTLRTLSGRSLDLIGFLLERAERHHDLLVAFIFLAGIVGVIATA